MATGLHPYLNFPGNTREVMEFYGQVFGVEPRLSTFGEFNAVPADSEHADKVMHSSLEVTDLIQLFAADHLESMAPYDYQPGNNINLSLMGDDEDRILGYFDGLAAGGNVIMPLERQVWGDLYGALIDKFGISWMFNIGPGESD